MPRNSEQNALLTRLLSFYKRRYSNNQTEMESKFNDAVKDLIDTGDVNQGEYIQFCIENDVEPTIKPKPKPSKKSSDNYTSSGCGGGYTRSSC